MWCPWVNRQKLKPDPTSADMTLLPVPCAITFVKPQLSSSMLIVLDEFSLSSLLATVILVKSKLACDALSAKLWLRVV